MQLSDINDIIKTYALTQYTLINEDLLLNDRYKYKEVRQRFKDKHNLLAKRSVLITTTVVYSIAKKRANQMLKALGLLLVTSGVPSRIVSILNRSGLVSAFKTLQAAQEINAEEQIRAVIDLARNQQVFIPYDNLCR